MSHVNRFPLLVAVLGSLLFLVSTYLVTSPLQVAEAAGTCDSYKAGVAIPSGYGASYNVFSTSKMLVSVYCNDDNTIKVTAGDGDPLTYVYNKGYQYVNGAWQQFTYSCSNLVSGAWCPGEVSKTITNSNSDGFLVSYSCRWNGTKWNCGCRDSACSTNYWQLQGWEKVVVVEDTNPDRVLVGAIRWDAWIGGVEGDDNEGWWVEQTLGPNKWHYRLPFYAKVTGSNSVEIRATTQAVIDKEIEHAKNAGIDYFAYYVYRIEDHRIALDLHMSSNHKSDVKYAYIMTGSTFNRVNYDPNFFIKAFSDPDYVKVDGGRPLVYVFQGKGSPEEMQALITLVTNAGIPRPYVVDMGSNIGSLADGHSRYAIVGGSSSGSSFSNLVSSAENKWRSQGEGVPLVSAGWDGRPRIDTPVPWVSSSLYTNWYHNGTPAEIANQLDRAIKYVKANPSKHPANSVLIYAWNEFDEGGWIAPNLPEHGGSSRLDAIADVPR